MTEKRQTEGPPDLQSGSLPPPNAEKELAFPANPTASLPGHLTFCGPDGVFARMKGILEAAHVPVGGYADISSFVRGKRDPAFLTRLFRNTGFRPEHLLHMEKLRQYFLSLANKNVDSFDAEQKQALSTLFSYTPVQPPDRRGRNRGSQDLQRVLASGWRYITGCQHKIRIDDFKVAQQGQSEGSTHEVFSNVMVRGYDRANHPNSGDKYTPIILIDTDPPAAACQDLLRILREATPHKGPRRQVKYMIGTLTDTGAFKSASSDTPVSFDQIDSSTIVFLNLSYDEDVLAAQHLETAKKKAINEEHTWPTIVIFTSASGDIAEKITRNLTPSYMFCRSRDGG